MNRSKTHALECLITESINHENIEMTLTPKNVVSFLELVKRIQTHHQEIRRAKGEHFNLFTVLKMEANENRTHSAFLAELLNPKGSHLCGSLFLKLFLETVGYKGVLDVETTNCWVEWSIGRRDDDTLKGGRIDIYLQDKTGNSISIENKIYAIDQFAQIQRYVNWNKSKNTVYYLNLDGKAPDDSSVGSLQVNKDFFHITYSVEIIEWLNACLKEVHSQAILRESLRQYLILIKKLTNNMEQDFENELNIEIIKNFSTSELIANQMKKIKNLVGDKLRNAVIEQLIKLLPEHYNVVSGNRITSPNAQIWIHPTKTKNPKLIFGMESFNADGNMDGNIFLGLFSMDGTLEKTSYLEHFLQYSNYWPHYISLGSFEDLNINMGNPDLVLKVYADNAFTERLANHIAETTKGFVLEHENYVDNVNESV